MCLYAYLKLYSHVGDGFMQTITVLFYLVPQPTHSLHFVLTIFLFAVSEFYIVLHNKVLLKF